MGTKAATIIGTLNYPFLSCLFIRRCPGLLNKLSSTGFRLFPGFFPPGLRLTTTGFLRFNTFCLVPSKPTLFFCLTLDSLIFLLNQLSS